MWSRIFINKFLFKQYDREIYLLLSNKYSDAINKNNANNICDKILLKQIGDHKKYHVNRMQILNTQRKW